MVRKDVLLRRTNIKTIFNNKLSFARLPDENCYLLSTVRRKVEYKNSEKRDAHARNNEIDSVEQRFSSHGDVKSDIKVRLITAGVKFNVSNSGHCEDVPLNGHVELGQVDADVDHVGPLLLFLVA